MSNKTSARPKFSRSHYGKYLIFFPSRKSGRQIVCESKLEAALCLFLEYETSVTTYCSQPTTFDIIIGSDILRYTPDFLIHYRNSESLYVEVKPTLKFQSAKYLEKLAHIKSQLESKGHNFRIITEPEIAIFPLQDNLRLLYFRSTDVLPCESRVFQETLKTFDFPMSIRQFLTKSSITRPNLLYRAIFNQELIIDLNLPLHLDSKIIGLRK